jgi:hypothetical protein
MASLAKIAEFALKGGFQAFFPRREAMWSGVGVEEKRPVATQK